MTDFANLTDGGRRLAPLLAAALGGPGVTGEPGPTGGAGPLLLAAIPNGVPVALGIAERLPLPVAGLPVERSDAGALVPPIPALAGRTVIVVDDGVETGSVARAAAVGLRASGVGRLVLAVPVCPRDALADLQRRYDLVVAVATPMGRRDLHWHYADFDTIDEARALRLLRDRSGA